MVQNKVHLLSIDLEEWFHILDYEETNSPQKWEKFPSRMTESTERLLALFEKHEVKATFFVLGWVARKVPTLVQKIADAGHEIGCHSENHSLIYLMSRDEFEQDLYSSISILRDISGQPVNMYRAPGFSITRKCLWAFDALVKQGITIDSSVFPAARTHGGLEGFPTEPFLIKTSLGNLRELPISTFGLAGKRVAFSGGGYFRLFPTFIHSFFTKSATKNAKPIIMYLHPRDIDASQPRLSLPLVRYIKTYINLNSTYHKLDYLLKNFSYGTVTDVISKINWEETKVVKLR
jgi:polysaccharide deacetylase family protein (PEP-CTERM system associated)